MEKMKSNTEQLILEAAEKVFLSQGFEKTKISDIARLAGANNALINYYFRSKENLFNKVVAGKIELLANSMKIVTGRNKPFLETIKDFTEAQHDFFRENEKLPQFILSEVFTDNEKAALFRDTLIPVILQATGQLEKSLNEEIKKGNVRKITMVDLLYMITSLNVLSFMVSPLISPNTPNPISSSFSQVMEDRKNKNVDIVMTYLKL